MDSATVPRWNHNIHYHPIVMDAVPDGAQTALDVGTGNGLLAAELHRIIPDVTAIDTDADVLDSARAEDPQVTWIHGNLMTHDFKGAAFDVVASVATLHHMPDLGASLTRLSELTSPGGVLVAVGLARSSTASDFAHDALGVVQKTTLKRRHVEWEHTAPTVWPPPHTYSEVRDAAREALPGVTWQRLTLWRYAIVWKKPI